MYVVLNHHTALNFILSLFARFQLFKDHFAKKENRNNDCNTFYKYLT